MPSTAASGAAAAGLILAGGRSRRFFGEEGGDKCLLSLGGSPLLAHVIARFSPQVTPLALNANGDPARFAAFGLPVIPDADGTFQGPLAGILAGMRWAAALPAPPSHIATVPADTPFLPHDFVARLRGALKDHPCPRKAAAIASADGEMHWAAGLWPLGRAAALARALEDGVRPVKAWLKREDWRAAAFPVENSVPPPFFNVNTPEDLRYAQELLRG